MPADFSPVQWATNEKLPFSPVKSTKSRYGRFSHDPIDKFRIQFECNASSRGCQHKTPLNLLPKATISHTPRLIPPRTSSISYLFLPTSPSSSSLKPKPPQTIFCRDSILMETSTTLGGWNSFKNPKLFEEIKPSSGGNKEWPFLINSTHFKQDNDELSLKKKKCYMTEEEIMIMGAVKKVSNSPNLLQNCDLPPPVKVFTGADEIVLNSIKSKGSNTSKNTKQEENRELPRSKSSEEKDKVDLMKALQLSQSRARTAEKKASQLAEERDRLSSLFLKESLRLFAHRQWMKLLQLEVSHLQSQKHENQHQHSCGNCKKKLEKDEGSSDAEDGENAGNLSWYMTLAICLGIAGVGVAVGLGYRYLLL